VKIALALVMLAACGGSQPPPPALPPIAPAPPEVAQPPPPPRDITSMVDGDVTDAQVHGIHVLVKRIPGAESTSTAIYLTGGAMTWTKETAGLEQLALATATEGGTKQLDKDAFAKRLADLGSSIASGVARDYSAMSAWSLTPAWDPTFDLLAQAFLTPALPATQLEIDRRQQVAELQHELDDPDSRLEMLADATLYKDHPYAVRPDGTVETVQGFTATQVAEHLATLRHTSRMLVVVVGDIDANHVIDSVWNAFHELPKGDTPPPVPAIAVAATGKVDVVTDKLPTTYIEARVVGPRWTDPDFPVARVAMEWLYQLEFEEVRTKRNLSYAPGAGFSTGSIAPSAYLYVTAVDPRTTMKVMLDQAKRMRDTKVSDHDLASAKAMLLTATFMAAEAPADQASQLAHAQIFANDWHYVRKLPQLVDAVTAEQVQTWCAKHLTHFETSVLGDGTKLDRAALESF
jgi:predicted Zn-dependent peptidase